MLRIGGVVALLRGFHGPAEATRGRWRHAGPTQALGRSGRACDIAVVMQVDIRCPLLPALHVAGVEKMRIETAGAGQHVDRVGASHAVYAIEPVVAKRPARRGLPLRRDGVERLLELPPTAVADPALVVELDALATERRAETAALPGKPSLIEFAAGRISDGRIRRVSIGTAVVVTARAGHPRAFQQAAPAGAEIREQSEPQAQGIGTRIASEAIITHLLVAHARVPLQLQLWRINLSRRVCRTPWHGRDDAKHACRCQQSDLHVFAFVFHDACNVRNACECWLTGINYGAFAPCAASVLRTASTHTGSLRPIVAVRATMRPSASSRISSLVWLNSPSPASRTRTLSTAASLRTSAASARAKVHGGVCRPCRFAYRLRTLTSSCAGSKLTASSSSFARECSSNASAVDCIVSMISGHTIVQEV